MRFTAIIFFLSSSLSTRAANSWSDLSPWNPVRYEILGRHQTVVLSRYANVFVAEKNSVTRISAELEGLTATRLPLNRDRLFDTVRLTFKIVRSAQLVIGLFRDSARIDQSSVLQSINLRTGRLRPTPVIKNAMSITGMPAVDIYVIDLPKGTHTVEYPGGQPFIFCGTIEMRQTIATRDAAFPDGRLWQPFIVEGFHESPPLFEIVGGSDTPVVDEGMPGTDGIQGGFEGGAIVKVGDTYHMFPTERAGEAGVPAYYDRVKTRIGHWTSTDAIKWKRVSTIYQSSGRYAITHDDNPLNDRRAAIWSYMPIFNEVKNRWYGYYLTYTVDREIEPNHSFGRIWQTESEKVGMEGIGGPYKNDKLIMEPGLNSQLWEGRQGVASFFPFKANGKWLGFYSGAYPFAKREDYPSRTGKGWFVGLATADSLEGPWTRLDTSFNPVTSIHPWFVENPIVYRLPEGIYIAVFDGGPEGWGHHLPNMIGYTLSQDGYRWSEARYLPIDTKVKKWWNIMRTPLCLIPEKDDTYTVVYAAINEKRFHPMGMVRLKMNREALRKFVELNGQGPGNKYNGDRKNMK